MITPPRTLESAWASGREAGGSPVQLLHYPPEARPRVRIGRFPLRVRTYHDAVAVPMRENAELTRFVGAVYSHDGDIVGESQRAKPGRKYHRNPPHRTDVPSMNAERLCGRTFFAGQLAYQFGHVLLESLTRFWPDLRYQDYNHFLVYPNRQRSGAVDVPELLQRVLALVGVDPDRIRVVGDTPLVLDTLDVASAPIRVGSAADLRFLDVFDRIGRDIANDPSAEACRLSARVYLSRSRLNDRRRATNETAIEAMMVARGFEILHPQETDLRRQFTIAAGADVLAGCDGSALHLAAFAREGTRLLALDTRSTPNQFLIDAARRLDAVHAWVGPDQLGSRKDAWTADLGRVGDGLDAVLERNRPRGGPTSVRPRSSQGTA